MIEAIKTWYEGVHYRSRTEARWAVFFDEMNVPARYEYEGYVTSHGWYLPDFWFADAPEPTFFEVKPGPPGRWELDCMAALAQRLDAHVFVAEGSPRADCVVWKVLPDRMRDRWEFGVCANNGALRLVRDGQNDMFLTMPDYDDWRSGWDLGTPAWSELERAGRHQFPIHDDKRAAARLPRNHRNQL